jgi:hypothetical protein
MLFLEKGIPVMTIAAAGGGGVFVRTGVVRCDGGTTPVVVVVSATCIPKRFEVVDCSRDLKLWFKHV